MAQRRRRPDARSQSRLQPRARHATTRRQRQGESKNLNFDRPLHLLVRFPIRLLQRDFIGQKELLDSILDQLKSGKENLHVIFWAVSSGISTAPVHKILEALDVNSRRLQHRFEAA